jgi:LmbE family N-acetylglucosaminyl deacetylase
MAQPVVVHPFAPLGEDWQHGLAIVAHPDDLEFGAAAAIARWTGQGKQLVYCLVTSGETGIDTMAPTQARQVRETEQRTAAAVVGVTVVEFLGQPDGIVEYGVPLRRALARVIRRHQPEIVITTNFRDTWDGAVVLNQADHRATGWAVLDAVCDGEPVFPERSPKAWGPGVAGGPVAERPSRRRPPLRSPGGVPTAHEAYLRGLVRYV